MKKILLPIILVPWLLLAGCGNTPWENPQQFSGLNHLHIEYYDTGSPRSVEVWGGKEQEAVSVEVTKADGTSAKYSASGVKAFEGQSFRAEVEKLVAEELGEVVPSLVDGFITLVNP